jgi:(p)ppGpp synthase/HD superfamily hydrolase
MSDIIEKARRFATEAHRRIDHRRRYTDQPYEVHPGAVAALVASVTDDPHMIAAAWLHDTVEDTPTRLEDIAREFGPDVAALVEALTDVSQPGDGNRATRKAIDRRHLAAAPPRAKTVKLADLIDNMQDICRHDPRFARVYLAEQRALLEVLGAGDGRLLRQARQTLDDCARQLGLTR